MKSQIATTIEQSKRLLNAGLDPKSADMCYIEEIITNGIGCIPYKRTWSEYPCVDTHEESEGPEPVSLPAWSLSKLIELAGKKETVVWIPEIAPQLDDVGDYIERLVHFLELPDVKILPGLHQK